MIKLKNLFKEEDSRAMYWWMDPQGKEYRVPLQGHNQFSKKYLTSIGKDISGDLYGTMQNLGWIRVIILGYLGQTILTFNGHPNSIQMDALRELAHRYHAVEIKDYSTGVRYELY